TARLINFEDEKEVKQYLDNIGVEFSYQCYREKDPEGCQRLSTTQVLKHNCEMNKHGEGFYKLGAYYVQGKGEVADNLKMAYSCFMTAYSSGGKKSVDACQNVGLLTDDGGETLKDSLMCMMVKKKIQKKSCFFLCIIFYQI
uniref:Cytochrome c oxidase assembly factor 7 n=2 Tax=Hucho hucho TaxID=62062 RepID=A0A4W5JYX8_9TELE